MSNILAFPEPARRQVHPARNGAPTRVLIEDEIERLISLLDVIDGDPDAEDDGAIEPSLGWTLTMAHGTTDDLEQGEVSL
ncbi:hypothetical protein [Aureimonas psammosilenae]|uniref:hypothetical protein n=1 Tax=Aureimonas psammosilenae TaxID=2495496 RepID=UPI001260F80B|nr:hypothetical protein [Aureimonas psammosilenae]